MQKTATNSVRAGFVQFAIQRGQVGANLAMVLAGLKSLARARANLAVLPEMWTSSFVPEQAERLIAESEAAFEQVRRFARKASMVIIGSSYERSGRDIYNTAYVIDANGATVGRYRKIHLFSPGGEHIHFRAGDQPLITNCAVGRVGVAICYDLRFPELVRGLCTRGAEIVAVPAQWPTARIEHWDALLRARAIENQVFVIGCNRTGTELRDGTRIHYPGHSTILDPWGRILTRRRRATAALYADLNPAVREEVRSAIPVWSDRKPNVYRIWTRPLR